jgi:hypothetical protein
VRWSDPEVHPSLKILALMGTHLGMADHITRLHNPYSSGALTAIFANPIPCRQHDLAILGQWLLSGFAWPQFSQVYS